MDLTHIRTENGASTLITTRAAVAEIEAAATGPTKRNVRRMYGSRSTFHIEYRDGRTVDIRPATPEQLAEHTQQPDTTKVTPADVEPAREYRTLKGAKVGDTLTLWERGNNKGPFGEPITVTVAETRGGWYVTRPDGTRFRFLGGTGSKYWVITA